MSETLPNQEKLLLKQIAEGDEKAFAQIFHAYRNKLFAFILKLSGSKEIAEDIVQDVFLKIWSRRRDLSSVENFNAFLFRVAHNHAVNQLMRLSRETLIRKKSGLNKSTVFLPDEQLMFNNIQNTLQEIINELPPQQKKVYQLKREQHLKQDEIADKLQISPSTVKNHLTQALHTIREKLMQYYPDVLPLLFILFIRMNIPV